MRTPITHPQPAIKDPALGVLGLTDEQKKAKSTLINDKYSFADFRQDWKDLEIGGRDEAWPFLAASFALVGLTPGVSMPLAHHIGIPQWAVAVPMLTILAISSWKMGKAIFSQVKEKNKAITSAHRWSDFKSSIPPPSSPDDLLIGYTSDKMLPFRIPAEALTSHGYIAGQSGVGKTVLGKLMMYQQIQRGGGLLFIDGKLDSDSYNELYAFCCLAGRRDDFLIINPGEPSLSNTYNPVIQGDSDEICSRILTLIPTTDGPASFYRSQATQALGTIISALQCLGKAFSFTDLVTLLQSDKALNEVSTLLMADEFKSDPRATAFQLWLDQYKFKDQSEGNQKRVNTDQLKKNLGGLGGELFRFATGKFGEVMNAYDPEVRLFEDMLANKIIYVALPTMGKVEAASALGKMFIGDLRTAVSRIQALPPEQRPGWKGSAQHPAKTAYFTFFDEVGSYAVQAMDKLFEQSRSAGIACYPASQTLANLEQVSKEFASQIIGNTWTKIFFKVGVEQTAEQLADLIGKAQTGTRSEGDSSSNSEGAKTLQISPQMQAGASEGETVGFRETETHLVSPDMLKTLGKGECVVLYGGNEVYHLKVPYTQVTAAGYKKIGPLQINHRRAVKVSGINLYDKTVKLINKDLLKEAS